MRFYDLILSNPTSGQVFKPSPRGDGFILSPGGSTFTSWVKGPTGRMQTDPGALHIEIDMPVTAQHESQGKHYISVKGVGLAMIGQSSDLNGASFALYGGMKPGLPLANPAQAGLLASGTIYQAFGNWQGVEQSLELICAPGGLEPENGIAFDWQPGTSLSSALQASFAQAFPQYTPDIKISPLYQVNYQEGGCYLNFDTFAQFVNELSTALGIKFSGRQQFQGVSIIISGSRIVVFDSTTVSKTVQLAFVDLIGQPTWLEPAAISFQTVMRADISVGDNIKFPQGIFAPYVLTSAAAAAPNALSRSKSVFQGLFKVAAAQHFGSFRQPGAESWVTSFRANVIPPLDVNLLNSTVAL